MARSILLPDGIVDLAAREVRRGEVRTGLGDLEARLLEFLAAREGVPAPPSLLLQEVWGYHPAVETKAVPLLVRRLREKIERDPSSPEVLKSSRQAGYWLVRREAASPFARTAERKALDEAIALSRIVTLHGPAGVGKTWLLEKALGGGRGLLLDLAGAAKEPEVLERLAARLEVPSTSAASIGLALRAKKDLVVGIDGTERALDALREIVPRFLSEVPQLRIVVASRALFHVPGEHVIPIAPLDPDAATALFVEAARRNGVELHGTDVGAVTERLDGLPLAIELAAARLRVLPLDELARRLASPLPLLRSPRGALEDTLALSWDGCSEPEQDDLVRVAAIRGFLDLEALEAVLGVDGIDRIEALVDKSLVVKGPPFGLLTTLRAFVQGRADSDTRARAVIAHSKFLASFLPLAGFRNALLGSARPPEAARLLAGRADLVDGFRSCLALGDRAGAVEIGMAHVQVERLLGSGIHVLLDELLAIDELPPAARVVLLLFRSWSDRRAGRDGDGDLFAAASLAESTGDPIDRRNVLFAHFAAAEFAATQRSDLHRLSRELEVLAAEMPDPAQEFYTLVTALSGRVDEGDDAAIQALRAKVEGHAEYLRQPRTRGMALNYLAAAEADPEQRRRRTATAAALYQEIGDRRAMCLARFHESMALALTSFEASKTLLTRLAADADEIGLVPIALEARLCHAALRLIEGAPSESLLMEAEQLANDLSSHFLVSATRMAAGEDALLDRLALEASGQSATDRLWFDWAEGEVHWRARETDKLLSTMRRASEAWGRLPRGDRPWPHVLLTSLASRSGSTETFPL